MCVPKGGRGCLRPSYGRPKLTLVSKKSSILQCCKKNFEIELAHIRSDLRGEPQFRKFKEIRFFATPHVFANGPHVIALTRLWATKTRSKKLCTPLSYRFFNLKCVRIPLLLVPNFFPLKIFGYRAIYEKVPFFTDFLVCTKKKYRACVPTILMQPTFRPI